MRRAPFSAWQYSARGGACWSFRRRRSNAVAARLASDGRIPRGYLGLGLHPVALTGGDGAGAMVMSVDPKGPGATAGVHQGDVIVALNGEPIRHVQSLLSALGPDRVGQTVTLDLRRAGETKQLSLTIGERPAA